MKTFLKKHSSTILTCIGALGVVATAVAAAKATPKAIERVQDEETERGYELSKIEKAKVAAPAYIPTAIVGAATITCIFGSNILNKRSQAVLTSAYALLSETHREYVDKTKKLYGEEADIEIRKEIAKDKCKDGIVPVCQEKLIFYDDYSLRPFESTIEAVINAENRLNQILEDNGYVSLNDFYDLVGLPRIFAGYEIGWSAYNGVEFNYHTRVDFTHEKLNLDDGLEGYVIIMRTEPIVDYISC